MATHQPRPRRLRQPQDLHWLQSLRQVSSRPRWLLPAELPQRRRRSRRHHPRAKARAKVRAKAKAKTRAKTEAKARRPHQCPPKHGPHRCQACPSAHLLPVQPQWPQLQPLRRGPQHPAAPPQAATHQRPHARAPAPAAQHPEVLPRVLAALAWIGARAMARALPVRSRLRHQRPLSQESRWGVGLPVEEARLFPRHLGLRRLLLQESCWGVVLPWPVELAPPTSLFSRVRRRNVQVFLVRSSPSNACRRRAEVLVLSSQTNVLRLGRSTQLGERKVWATSCSSHEVNWRRHSGAQRHWRKK